MKNTQPFNSAVLTFVLLLIGASVMAGQFGGESGGFDLSWNTIDSGGGASSGGAFTLTGTIGQPDVSTLLAGGTFELAGGFWANAGPTPTTCTGDIFPSGGGDGMVNVNDLLTVISGWGPCPGTCPPSCTPDISPQGGDCQVNVNDLLAIIGAWGLCP